VNHWLRKILGFEDWGPFDGWDRVGFDFANYSPLRRMGLTHKQTCVELDRLWVARETQEEK
jgi:hypothetical protein